MKTARTTTSVAARALARVGRGSLPTLVLMPFSRAGLISGPIAEER
jgi:hypothetical protein